MRHRLLIDLLDLGNRCAVAAGRTLGESKQRCNVLTGKLMTLKASVIELLTVLCLFH